MFAEKHKELEIAVDKTLKSLNNVEGLAQDVLDGVITDVLTKFHHKLGVGVEDSVSDLLDDFKQKVVNQIINEANCWKIPKSDVVIFPRGCRFYYEKGDSTIVVLEEEPRRRTVKFNPNILSSEPRTRMLPFPYIVYIFHAKDNRLCNSYIGWRSTPLTRIQDKLSRSLLPNSHSNLEICWGISGMPIGDSISQLCENAIADYWGTEFNKDLSARWDKRKRVSELLAPLSIWGRQDTVFMMSLDYSELDDPTVEEKIKQITGHIDEPNMDEIRHRLYDLANKHSEILFSKIIRYFKKVRPERFCPKGVTDDLKKNINVCVNDFLDIFYVLQFEYNKLKARIEETEDKRVTSRGPYWDEEMKNG